MNLFLLFIIFGLVIVLYEILKWLPKFFKEWKKDREFDKAFEKGMKEALVAKAKDTKCPMEEWQ